MAKIVSIAPTPTVLKFHPGKLTKIPRHEPFLYRIPKQPNPQVKGKG